MAWFLSPPPLPLPRLHYHHSPHPTHPPTHTPPHPLQVPSTRPRVIDAAALPASLRSDLDANVLFAGIALASLVGLQALIFALAACQRSAVDPLNQGLLEDDEVVAKPLLAAGGGGGGGGGGAAAEVVGAAHGVHRGGGAKPTARSS